MITMTKFNMLLGTLSLALVCFAAQAQQAPKAESKKVTSKNTPATYVIETQVQGSQEQPKVIYITPWQELNSTLNIEEHELRIRLPALAPINPKVFRDNVNSYYQQQKSSNKE